MGVTRVSLSGTQCFPIFSRMEWDFFFNFTEEANTSFPHSLTLNFCSSEHSKVFRPLPLGEKVVLLLIETMFKEEN